jgi:uncharacterized protein YbjT (DUF2867 family)
LFRQNTKHQVFAAVRNIEHAKKIFIDFPELQFKQFDFEDKSTYHGAFENIDMVFLLRPPHISNVKAFFVPLLEAMKLQNVEQIMFLSVQGAEKSKFIPHHKIEKLILQHGFNYIFLRPSYFMQNLNSTLREDIRDKGQIILPAGGALFNWVDVANIGEMAACILNWQDDFINQGIEITGEENLNFYEICNILSREIQQTVAYKSVGPVRFYFLKRKKRMARAYALVMIMLHFLPRFAKPPLISDNYQKITGKKPTSITDFIKRERSAFILDDGK